MKKWKFTRKKVVISDAAKKFKDLSLYKLGRELGVPSQQLYVWEKGVVTPSLDNLLGIADFLGCGLDDLVVDEEKWHKRQDRW